MTTPALDALRTLLPLLARDEDRAVTGIFGGDTLDAIDAARAAIEASANSRNEEESMACKSDDDLSDEARWAGIAAGMITPAHIARPTVAEQDQINAESAIRSIYGTPSAPLPNDRCIHPSGPHPQNEFCAWRTPKTKGVME